jgi:hypothetical protein
LDIIKATILHEPWDVDRRIYEMQLTREGLLSARTIAMNEAAYATPFHPSNAAGTFSYHNGTWAIRDKFVGKVWVVDRDDGIEAIRNETLKLKIAFSNVDLACEDNHSPKPRSRKGAGAERAGGPDLFGDLPHYVSRPTGNYALYYLMVDPRGAAELTRPVVKGGTFMTPIERIYLSRSGDDDGALLLDDNSDIASGFDPQVARK